MHTCMHTYINTYIQMNMHVYIYIYIYIYICSPPKIYIFSSESLQITRNHETPLFTTLLAMVFNTVFLLQWSTTRRNKRRKLHDFGGAMDTGDRAWDLPHQRADPHQLSYACNFPVVLFLFPPLSNGEGNKSLIGKGPPSTVGDARELFVVIRKAFPSIVRGFLPWLGISFYSKGFHFIVRELFRPCAPCVWIWVWSCLFFG